MAINQNHLFEELNGVKCGIVEKNVKPERLAFLRELLELNGFTVIAAPSPPPKPPPAPPAAPATAAAPSDPDGTATAATPQPPPPPPPSQPETYTVGVTDITFNPINAIFGRLLRSKEGDIVTLAYWHQKEDISRDDIPYFEKSN